ncbi:MAG: HAD-IB family phosphatase [Gammaproteobacteria bacterium]
MTHFYDVESILFDCDSTLSSLEGIDELAKQMGMYDQLAPLTQAAMEGEIKLDAVYKKRLELIRPDKNSIAWLAQRYIDTLVIDTDVVIAKLQKSNKQIHIISGGLRQAILPLASKLNIAEINVHAVDVYFDDQGNYVGFNEQSPLAQSGGKAVISQRIIGDKGTAVMIGDGVTDLEAQHERVHFIGFGGVVVRELVRNQSRDYIEQTTLLPLLDRLLSQNQQIAISSQTTTM